MLRDFAAMMPHTQHIPHHMYQAKDYGHEQHRLVGLPAGRLLMPKAGDNAEQAEANAEQVDDGGASPVGGVLKRTVAYAIVGVDIEADEHP